MNSKWHFYTSLVKSLLRIAGCAIAVHTRDWTYMALLFFLAEWLGVIEELGDKR